MAGLVCKRCAPANGCRNGYMFVLRTAACTDWGSCVQKRSEAIWWQGEAFQVKGAEGTAVCKGCVEVLRDVLIWCYYCYSTAAVAAD